MAALGKQLEDMRARTSLLNHTNRHEKEDMLRKRLTRGTVLFRAEVGTTPILWTKPG